MKTYFAEPTPRASDTVDLGQDPRELAFPSLPVMLMLLVWGLHFETHWSSYSSQSQMQVRLLLCQSEHTREFTDLVSGLGKEVTGTNTMIQQLSKFFLCPTI